jgi:hypothetical protein
MRAHDDGGPMAPDASTTMDAAPATDTGTVVPPMTTGGCSANGRGGASAWALAAIVAFLVSRRAAW